MVNLDKYKKKYEKLKEAANTQGGEGDTNFMVLQDEANLIRILPLDPADELAKSGGKGDLEFHLETATHRVAVGQDISYYPCPRFHKDETCPICDLYVSLWKTGNDKMIAVARDIKAKKRFYINVVDRADGKVKILSMGIKLFEQISSTLYNPDYGDITHLQEGFDYSVFKSYVSQKGKKWPDYSQSTPRRQPTPLAQTPAEVNEILEGRLDLTECINFAEPEVLDSASDKIRLAISGETQISNPGEPSTGPDLGIDYLSNLNLK